MTRVVLAVVTVVGVAVLSSGPSAVVPVAGALLGLCAISAVLVARPGREPARSSASGGPGVDGSDVGGSGVGGSGVGGSGVGDEPGPLRR